MNCKLAEAFARRVQENAHSLGISPGDRLLIALSGGLDSTVLLHLFAKMIPETTGEAYKIAAAHLCHLIRPESPGEKPFLEALCRSLRVRLFWRKADVPRSPLVKKLGIEGAARVLRYAFLQDVFKTTKSQGLLLGHHLDDRIETFLDRILTGGGIDSLDALWERRTLVLDHTDTLKRKNGDKNSPATGLPILRPLLPFAKEELLAYAKAVGLRWIEDRTNVLRDYRRNRIRLELLPLLRSFNPGIVRRLAFLAGEISASSAFEKETLSGKIAKIVRRTWFGKELDIRAVKEEPPRVQRLLIAEFIKGAGLGRSLDSGKIGRVVERALSGRGAEQLSAGLSARVFRSRLVLSEREMKKTSSLRIELPESEKSRVYSVGAGSGAGRAAGKGKGEGEGSYRIEAWRSCSGVFPGAAAPGIEERIFYADADELEFPLTWRPVRRNDLFSPFGGKGTLPVSEFLKKACIPEALRDYQTLLLDAKGRILWIPLVRRGEWAKVSEETRSIFRLTLTFDPVFPIIAAGLADFPAT